MNNKKYPKISVVMLNYNGLKYLKKTISPILKLDYPNFEFIIVDNGSTEGSIEFIEKIKKIKLIKNKENLGYSKGKNIGIKKANGSYIFLIDEDILLNNKHILKNFIKLSNSKEFISPIIMDLNIKKTKYYGTSLTLYGPKVNLPKSKKELKKLNPFYSSCFHGAAVFFKKTLWNRLKGYDENQPFYLDDQDLSPRIWINGLKIKIIPKINVTHLGTINRRNDKSWCWKFQYVLSGYSRSFIKSYKLNNCIFSLILFFFYCLAKALKQSIIRKNLCPLISFIHSLNIFLKNLPDTLKQRKKIQSKRIIKEDIFLKIKPPKFD